MSKVIYTTLYKYPEESRLYGFDFSEQPELATSTLTGTPTITSRLKSGSGTLTIGTASISGSIVQFRVTGGTIGAVHEILCRVSTSGSDILAAIGLLKLERV